MALDRFSGHADLYARYRIDYPTDLYDFVLTFVAGRERAWDCATGNGQVAGALAAYFQEVEATDLSASQLAQAIPADNIRYQPSPAEQTPFPDQHFDLITVGQALHWFEVEAFHREVQRVGRPGGVIAEWGYGLNEVTPEIDRIVRQYYQDIVGPFWDSMRRHIEDEYAQLPFPCADARYGRFTVRRTWDSDWLLNYLRTWSAGQKYQQAHGHDPVDLIADELKQAWGDGEREVRFPVFLRLGKIG